MVTRITRNTRMASTMPLFILSLSAAWVRPAALALSPTCFLKSASALADSAEKAWRSALSVADGAVKTLSPIVIVAGEPAGPTLFSYGMYDWVRVRLAISQELEKSISRAIGLPWKEHCAGSAVTVTLVACWAATRPGLAALS